MSEKSRTHKVNAVFTFKDGESKNKFLEFCNGENGLSVTRSWQGCLSIECYEARDNPNQVTIWQEWEDSESHESYVKHRHNDGSFEFLHTLIQSPPEITALRPVNFKTDEEQVRDIVNDMCDKDHRLGMKHMSDECVFVRPTGNPLSKKSWDDMMNNEDVTVKSSQLLSVNKLTVYNDTATVCYTSRVKFNYKGTVNDDVAVFTNVLRKQDGVWKVVLGQRSTGRSPDDPLPHFD